VEYNSLIVFYVFFGIASIFLKQLNKSMECGEYPNQTFNTDLETMHQLN